MRHYVRGDLKGGDCGFAMEVMELSHEVSSGLFSLFSPLDPGVDSHGFRVSSLQLSKFVHDRCYGGWVGIGCSLEFI